MKPILFNTEMVRAILAARKSVTRRVVKPQPLSKTHPKLFVEPPYRPGDILYVRETFHIDYLSNIPGTGRIQYKADDTYADFRFSPARYEMMRRAQLKPGWRPNGNMPREAARLFLRATDVWVERLQDITEDGTMQEGIQHTDFGTYLPNWKMSIDGGKTFHRTKEEIHYPGYHVGQVDDPDQCYPTARGAYHALWDSILKPADRPFYGWDANPWVWVIEFERISKEDIPPAELAG